MHIVQHWQRKNLLTPKIFALMHSLLDEFLQRIMGQPSMSLLWLQLRSQKTAVRSE